MPPWKLYTVRRRREWGDEVHEMSDAQEMVTAFHRAFDIAIGTLPAVPDAATCALRVSLIQEEFAELCEALSQRDIEAVAKELADLLYVVYGTAVSCGIDMAPVFQEVHRSNMSKVGGHKRADGKWIKPPDYSPARLQPILASQGRLEDHDGAGASPPAPTQDNVPQVVQGELLPVATNDRPGRHSHHTSLRMPESLTMRCPQCGKSFVRRSHRQGLKERLLSLVYLYPFRCQVCAHRFRAFQFRSQYVKRPVIRHWDAWLLTWIPTTFAEDVKPGEHRVGEGIVTDLSLGSCYMQTAVQLSPGTLMSLELQTEPHTPPIAVEAAIVRIVRPTGVGLEFLRMREPEQERFSQFIHQLLVAQFLAEAEDS
jgi:predicted HAD superfamily Cof-like phosphohydrolase